MASWTVVSALAMGESSEFLRACGGDGKDGRFGRELLGHDRRCLVLAR